MLRILFLWLVPLYLFGALTFESNHNKELDVLHSFDIDASFLHDPIMNKIKEAKRSKYQHKHFFQAMDEAYLFIPTIKSILAEHDLPAEFLFLAMAESNFSTRAFSKKRASGLWQFMPYTGKLYGLKIDEYVDERRDLIKSTKAATKYLAYLHKRFGKWYLAAIAYNCGGGRLNKAIKRAGSDDLAVLLDPEKKYIPRESRLYIRKIVALALLGTDESFLIEREYAYLLNRANAYSIATVKVPRGEQLSRVAKLLQMPHKDLVKLNRHLKYDFVPPHAKTYDIHIPYIKLSDFKKDYKPPELEQIYIVHTVTSGDNLSYIGKKYGVRYRAIKDFNNLKSDRLSLRQKLIIPIVKPSKNDNHAYVVKRGDTLESIALAYRLSVKELKRRNGLNSDLIRIGAKLTIYE